MTLIFGWAPVLSSGPFPAQAQAQAGWSIRDPDGRNKIDILLRVRLYVFSESGAVALPAWRQKKTVSPYGTERTEGTRRRPDRAAALCCEIMSWHAIRLP